MSSRFSLDLGMPLLGRNNLSECALFKALGDHRWRTLEEIGGTRSARIQDDAGARLYATFFFVDVDLPPGSPLSSFGENDRVDFSTDLFHYGKSYLDGTYVLEGDRGGRIRASNVFIYQERGPSKLTVSFPANVDFRRLPELPAEPDSLQLCRQARARGCFLPPETDDVPLYEGRREFLYALDPDRDLNGAGLVYFANFIAFLDLAERNVLGALPDPIPDPLLDSRSTYRRIIGYYGNAQGNDRLAISVAARMRPGGVDDRAAIDMSFDYTVKRSSDDKLIVVSSCRKMAAVGESPEARGWIDRNMALFGSPARRRRQADE